MKIGHKSKIAHELIAKLAVKPLCQVNFVWETFSVKPFLLCTLHGKETVQRGVPTLWQVSWLGDLQEIELSLKIRFHAYNTSSSTFGNHK